MDDQPVISPEPAPIQPPVPSPPPEPTIPSASPLSSPLPKNSNKKTILFIVIAIVLIAAAGFGAYKWEHNRAAKTENAQQSQIDSLNKQVGALESAAKKATNATSSSSTSKDVNTYAGWKTYTSSSQPVSFMYPSSWKLQIKANPGEQTGGKAHQVILTSPRGFSLEYTDEVVGLSNASCSPQSAPAVALTGVAQITGTGAPNPVYLVQSGAAIGLYSENQPPSLGSAGSCSFYPLMLTGHPGPQMQFATGLQFPSGTPKAFPANQTQDFATAKLILESFKFNN